MRTGNHRGWGISGLDPPPLGERERMDFLRKTYASEMPDENVWISSGKAYILRGQLGFGNLAAGRFEA